MSLHPSMSLHASRLPQTDLGSIAILPYVVVLRLGFSVIGAIPRMSVEVAIVHWWVTGFDGYQF